MFDVEVDRKSLICLPSSATYPCARIYEYSKCKPNFEKLIWALLFPPCFWAAFVYLTVFLLLFTYELHRQLHAMDSSPNISVKYVSAIHIIVILVWDFAWVVFKNLNFFYMLVLWIQERLRPTSCANFLNASQSWPLRFWDACASCSLLRMVLVQFLMQLLLRLYASLPSFTIHYTVQFDSLASCWKKTHNFCCRRYRASTSLVGKGGRSSLRHFLTIWSLQKLCGLLLMVCFKNLFRHSLDEGAISGLISSEGVVT